MHSDLHCQEKCDVTYLVHVAYNGRIRLRVLDNTHSLQVPLLQLDMIVNLTVPEMLTSKSVRQSSVIFVRD